MTTLIYSTTKVPNRSVPSWFLRLLGYSSLAVTILNFALLLCRRYRSTRRYIKPTPLSTINPPHETLKKDSPLRRTSSSLADIRQDKFPQPSRSPPPYTRTPSPQQKQQSNRWGSRLVDNVIAATSVLKKKKRLTISLKNTILWNPSQDVTVSNHAFHENAVLLLSRLCQRYEVYLLIHTNSEDDHEQIKRLLAPIIGNSATSTGTFLLDPSRVIYCQDEMTKVHLVQNVLLPAIHVEGGWELDDGEDIIRGLNSSVSKLIWVITRRRRTSFNKENMKPADHDLLLDSVELTDSLLDTTLAREVGFVID